MHIWKPETAQERKIADQELEALNALREPELRTEWELSTGMQRIDLRHQVPGRKPVWKFTKERGKLVREAKAGGIDWY